MQLLSLASVRPPGRPGSDGPWPGQPRWQNRRALTCRGNCPAEGPQSTGRPGICQLPVTACPATTIGSPVSGRVWLSPEFRDELFTEGRQIVGLTAGYEHVGSLGAHLYLGVYPGPACVPDIGLQARPGGQGPSAHQVCLHKCPRTVADDCGRRARLEQCAGEQYCGWYCPQLVRVGYSTRQYQRIVVSRVGIADNPVDREGACLVEMIECLGSACLGREELWQPSGIRDGFPGAR